MTSEPRITIALLGAHRRCMFGLPARFCGAPAVAHLLVAEDGEHVMVCKAHAPWWVKRPHVDRHPIGGECGLPGTTWVASDDLGPGRCMIDGLDMPDLFATEAEMSGGVA
jgi:hypothetical protein